MKIILILIDKLNEIINLLIIKRKMKVGTSIIGDNFNINGILKLYGDGRFVIGNDVRINSSEISNPIGGMTHTVISISKPGVLEIGNNVGMSNTAIVCRKHIVIEDNVKIGGSVKIYDTDFHSLDFRKRNSKEDFKYSNCKDIIIKKDAFIGAHSIILKGVTIGERAIIGAGSVVTKDVGDDEIWGGNPAKKIRGFVCETRYDNKSM